MTAAGCPHGPEIETLAADVRHGLLARTMPGFDPERGETIVLADAPGAGHWAGAPSLVVDENGRALLSYRRRAPRDGSENHRGYLGAIAESTDGGRSFRDIWRVTKHEVGTSSLERFCLRRAPEGDWLLYTSWEDPPSSGRWRIDLMRAPAPESFSPPSAVSVLLPDDLGAADAAQGPGDPRRGDPRHAGYLFDRGLDQSPHLPQGRPAVCDSTPPIGHGARVTAS